jgi:hypothetical protein
VEDAQAAAKGQSMCVQCLRHSIRLSPCLFDYVVLDISMPLALVHLVMLNMNVILLPTHNSCQNTFLSLCRGEYLRCVTALSFME